MHRIRVIIDNDFSGDPDGLVQLAHQVLCTTTEVRLVVGSHLPIGHPFTTSTTTAADAAHRAGEVLAMMGPSAREVPVVAGSDLPMHDRGTPALSDAASRIVSEAMRESSLPLFVVCGASLTEVATAYLVEPRIAERLTVVWIGGPEHPDAGAPPWPDAEVEYNLSGDVAAAQVVFGSALPLWQVPRNAYRQAMVSLDVLELRMRPHGALGELLFTSLVEIVHEIRGLGMDMGETFCLGDSPLVLLTSLQSGFAPDAASSEYRVVPRPDITDDGGYLPRPGGAPMRVYTRLDVRLMMDDLYAKLEKHERATREA